MYLILQEVGAERKRIRVTQISLEEGSSINAENSSSTNQPKTILETVET